MVTRSNRWNPTAYTPWIPDRHQAYQIEVLGIGISTKPGKHPSVWVRARALPLGGGRAHWDGTLYFTFGRSDRYDAQVVDLVEFFHDVAKVPIQDNPDWDKLSQGIRWKRFVGRLSHNASWKNLLSIQTVDELGEGLQCLAWSTDGMCFVPTLSTYELIPVEVLELGGQLQESEAPHEEDPLLITDDDDRP